MFHLQKATQVTSDDDEQAMLRWLAGHYPYPPRPNSSPCLGAPYVRADFVSSIDGAVTHNGKSGELAGPGDKAIFRMMRGLADVVLVGARTALHEGYRQPSPDEVFVGARRADGQAPAPALALASRSLDIPTDYPPLADPQTVVLTCRDAPDDKRAELIAAGATLVNCGDTEVDLKAVLDLCAERGWYRVLCEGGPTLLGSLIEADLLDELALTTSPHVTAGDAGRIAHSPGAGVLRRMRAETVLTDDDGFVYTRWVRAGRSAD